MLARLMEDEDLAKMVVESFLEDIPRQIDSLKVYLEAGDATGAERQAHTIKGASANVGGERLLKRWQKNCDRLSNKDIGII